MSSTDVLHHNYGDVRLRAGWCTLVGFSSRGVLQQLPPDNLIRHYSHDELVIPGFVTYWFMQCYYHTAQGNAICQAWFVWCVLMRLIGWVQRVVCCHVIVEFIFFLDQIRFQEVYRRLDVCMCRCVCVCVYEVSVSSHLCSQFMLMFSLQYC